MVFQKELYNFESLCVYIYAEDMYSALNCHNVAKYARVLPVTVTVQCDSPVMQDVSKELYKKKTPWPKSASELYRPSDRRLPAKLMPTFADRRWHVVSVTDPYCRIVGFLGWSCSCIHEAEWTPFQAR
jgi:hypothetical protein